MIFQVHKMSFFFFTVYDSDSTWNIFSLDRRELGMGAPEWWGWYQLLSAQVTQVHKAVVKLKDVINPTDAEINWCSSMSSSALWG